MTENAAPITRQKVRRRHTTEADATAALAHLRNIIAEGQTVYVTRHEGKNRWGAHVLSTLCGDLIMRTITASYKQLFDLPPDGRGIHIDTGGARPSQEIAERLSRALFGKHSALRGEDVD